MPTLTQLRIDDIAAVLRNVAAILPVDNASLLAAVQVELNGLPRVNTNLAVIPAERSGDISAIAYDSKTRVLDVEYRRTTRVWRYYDVPKTDFVRIMQATSMGSTLRELREKNHYIVRALNEVTGQ